MNPELDKRLTAIERRLDEIELKRESQRNREYIRQDVEIIGNLLVRGSVQGNDYERKSGNNYVSVT